MMYEIAVIGGGPAGAAAATFTGRAGKKTLLLDADKGMTRRAMLRNHLGVLEVTGPDLVETGHRQATNAGAELVKTSVLDIVRTSSGFELKTEAQTYGAKHVILATGASTELAEKMGLATRPASQPRIKTVVVVDAVGRTSQPGVWAAGTVADVSVHTIVTAGDGARVAINLLSDLNGARWVDHDAMKT